MFIDSFWLLLALIGAMGLTLFLLEIYKVKKLERLRLEEIEQRLHQLEVGTHARE